MATKYGMGSDDLGPVAYGDQKGTAFLGYEHDTSRNYSEETARAIDSFVKKTLSQELTRAKTLVQKHKVKLDELAIVLLKKETMSLEEFLEIFEGKKK